MKELSIEEKAKRYDKAIKKAEPLYKAAEPMSGCNVIIETIFPELAESEDEVTRKAIINFLHEGNPFKNIKKETRQRWIAWLEKQDEPVEINPTEFDLRLNRLLKQFETLPKEELASSLSFYLNVVQNDGTYKSDEEQGESKPADNVEPKFHEGEWVVYECGEETATLQITRIVGKTYVFSDDSTLNVVDEDTLRLWDIAKDAKDGDVLHSIGWHDDCIFIFNGIDNWKFDEPNGDKAVATGYCCLFVSSDKMDFGIQGPDCIEVDTVKPATKIQRDLLFQKMKEAGYKWDAEKKKLKKIEQKPTWSEEDMEMIRTLVAIFEVNYPNGFYKVNPIGTTNMQGIHSSEIIKWLKSLENRVQPKQEWSEEDEKHLSWLIEHLGQSTGLYDNLIDWPKSLKDSHAWKPSDEQMNTLEQWLKDNQYKGDVRYCYPIFESLYQDLKRL